MPAEPARVPAFTLSAAVKAFDPFEPSRGQPTGLTASASRFSRCSRCARCASLGRLPFFCELACVGPSDSFGSGFAALSVLPALPGPSPPLSALACPSACPSAASFVASFAASEQAPSWPKCKAPGAELHHRQAQQAQQQAQEAREKEALKQGASKQGALKQNDRQHAQEQAQAQAQQLQVQQHAQAQAQQHARQLLTPENIARAIAVAFALRVQQLQA